MATVNKRYYWLKLQEGFFRQKEIKRLRKIAGGDTYTIIYLKMLLQSLSSHGVLFFDSIENDFISELALDIDENEEDVAITVQYLMSKKILVEISEDEYLLTTCEEMVGSETASTRRSRKHRNNLKALQCNTDATKRNGEKEIEIEIEKEIEERTLAEMQKRQEEREKHEKVTCQQIADLYNDTCVSFPQVRTLSEKRKKAIKVRLKKYSLDDFKTLFIKAEASDFLKGANKRNWSATFDWLIEDGNMAKVLDGNYDNKQQTSGRKEVVPQWMSKNQQEYDYDEIERDIVANSPDLDERVKALKERIGGGNGE